MQADTIYALQEHILGGGDLGSECQQASWLLLAFLKSRLSSLLGSLRTIHVGGALVMTLPTGRPSLCTIIIIITISTCKGSMLDML